METLTNCERGGDMFDLKFKKPVPILKKELGFAGKKGNTRA